MFTFEQINAALADNSVIDDGYTEWGYIAAVPGKHGPLAFRYRPMLPEEREAVRMEIVRHDKPATHHIGIMAAALAEKLVEWDAKAQGKAVPVTLDTIRRCRQLDRLYDVVAGYKASDMPPAAKGEDVTGYAARLLEAAKGDSKPGAALEAKQGN